MHKRILFASYRFVKEISSESSKKCADFVSLNAKVHEANLILVKLCEEFYLKIEQKTFQCVYVPIGLHQNVSRYRID